MMTLLRQARLQPRTAAMLKWEAILNDPLGTLLAVLVFEYYIFSHGSLPLNQVLINFAWGLGASIALDLSEIGVLLAATDNDAYNALVCLHFSAEFGRDWVYQLPMREVQSAESKAVSQTSRGHIILSEQDLFYALQHLLHSGWTFTRTVFSAEYNYLKFRTEHVNARPVLVRRASGELEFKLAIAPLEPKAGDTLISFGPPKSDPRPSRTKAA